jgi:hypothetical protein
MTRKLKSVGIAFIAVLAMSAVVASAAHATNTNIHTAKASAVVTGDGPLAGVVNVFTVTNGSGKNLNTRCEGTNTFKGALVGGTTTTSETLTLTAVYKNCNIAGSESAVQMNGCDFLFHSNSTTLTTFSTDIVCPIGQEITEVSPAGCTIHIPPQNGLTTVTLTNTGAVGSETRDMDANLNLTGIKYTITAGCPLTPVTLTTTDGTYKEELTITAETAAGVSVGIFAD